MAHLAFSSLGSLLFNIGWYIFLIVLWWTSWHYRFSRETFPDGRKRYTNFWDYWLGPENEYRILNWSTFLLWYSYTFFRLCCTIFYGYKGGA